MHKTNTPIRLWDYAYEYSAQIRSLTVTKQVLLKDRTPFEHVKGYTPDISEFTTFKWYEWCWYYKEDNMLCKHLGRWLGPAHSAGQGLLYHILTTSGYVHVRSSAAPLSEDDNNNEEICNMKDNSPLA